MKVQCIDVQSAQAIVQHASQYRFQDHGILISAEGDTLNITPASATMRTLTNAIGKLIDLFTARRDREVDQQAVNSGSAA